LNEEIEQFVEMSRHQVARGIRR